MPDQNPDLSTILQRVKSIESEAERALFLDQVCGADEQLRTRIETLIDHDGPHGTVSDDQMGSKELSGSLDTFQFEDSQAMNDTTSPCDTQEYPANPGLEETTPPPSETPSSPDAQSSLIPTQAGRYQILAEVARGGMGAVLLAHDPELDRKLAVKIMLVNSPQNLDLERRFLEESNITAGLQHPGIPPVHDRGRLSDGCAFFAMKLIEGQTLGELLAQRKDRQQDLPLYLGIFKQICQTIGFAHSRDILHRDIKPLNIMVGSFGEVQVMDWGLAKNVNSPSPAGNTTPQPPTPLHELAENATLEFSEDPTQQRPGQHLKTQMGTILGTPAYMAPEQARGEIIRVDKRGDVFGLGSILCEILTGKPTFLDKRALDRVRKSAAGDLSDAYRRLDHCGADQELIQLAKTCLDPDPAKRPSDAGKIAEAISIYEQNVQNKLHEAEISRAESEIKAAEEEKRYLVETQKRKAERQRNRLLLSLAATLLLFTIGGSFVANSIAANRAMMTARQGYLETEIKQVLSVVEEKRNELVKDLRDPLKFHRYTSNLEIWSAKLKLINEAHARAISLIDGDKEKLVSPETIDKEQELAKLLRLDQEQFELASKLDNIFFNSYDLSGAGPILYPKISGRFREAFKSTGIDFSGPQEEIADAITALPYHQFIVSALDFWIGVTPDEKEREFLQILNRALDNNARNHQVRDAIEAQDLTLLTKVARTILPQEHSPQLLGRFARIMQLEGGDGISFLRKASLKHPQNFWLHYQLGSLQTDVKEQIGSYNAAIAIRPDSEIAYNNLAVLLAKRGDLEIAIDTFKRSIEINDEHDVAHYNLGKTYMLTDQVDKAIIELKRAIEINASYVKAYLMLGEAFESTGELDNALKQYDAALLEDPNNPKIQINLGITWDLKGDPEKAIPYFKRALELQPNYHIAHGNWALALRKLDKLPEALEHYQLAIRFAPYGHPARREYARAVKELQDELGL